MSTPVALSRPWRLRSFADRARQVIAFKVGGVTLITPLFAPVSGTTFLDTFGVLSMLAVVVAVWNGILNTVFDWGEALRTGRTADRRPIRLRVVQVLALEGGVLFITVPVLATCTGVPWIQALMADMGLTITYCVYGFLFNIVYDKLFRLRQVSHSNEYTVTFCPPTDKTPAGDRCEPLRVGSAHV
jgi:uncharacterized membrane protein